MTQPRPDYLSTRDTSKMRSHLYEFQIFTRHFCYYIYYVRGILCGLILLLLLGAFGISALEDMELGEAVYFAFITGLSIGYGDVVPDTTTGRLISVCIGLIGMLLTGMTIATATRALADTVQEIQTHIQNSDTPNKTSETT